MSNDDREVLADWLIVVGAVALVLSLFLTWSHQFSPSFMARFGSSDLLRGIPRDPTAWQVYSAADVVLALLGVGLLGVALIGSRPARQVAAAASLAGLVFAFHAVASPPTNGADVFRPDLGAPGYLSVSPGAGFGETVAVVGLVVALGGLALSFTVD